MKSILRSSGYRASLFAAVAVLTGCSTGSLQSRFVPSAPAANAAQHTSIGYVYVSNRTRQGSSELLVYPEGVQNPVPSLTITQNLADVGGIAVDSSGNVYVANGGAGNVLEFAPGGSELVETYSLGLVHPIDVAVANGTLYVADQGDAENGYSQQIVEYAIGNGTPVVEVAGLGYYPVELNEGVAVDPLDGSGAFFASATSLTAIPFTGGCTGSSSLVAENLLPTLWQIISLSNNLQASGLAFDSSGNLYAADLCANDVAIYSENNYVWTYAGKVPGTFNAPLFLTVHDHFLAIPSGASSVSGSSGRVAVIDLSKRVANVNITQGLRYPVGAVVVAGS